MSPRLAYRERRGLTFVQAEVNKDLFASLETAFLDVPRARIVRRALSELNDRVQEGNRAEERMAAA